MVDLATIQIDDLNTLRVFISSLNTIRLEYGRPNIPILLRRAFVNVKDLSINLRLPLAAYNALEDTGRSTLEPSLISTWTEIVPALKSLSRLRRLHIWLDHDEPRSWLLVNERAVVSPLASLSTDLDISIDLPKLHPKLENPDWHFMEDTPQVPLSIHRRYRQRRHIVNYRNGTLVLLHKPDFPITYEFTEWGLAIEEVEKMEREVWKTGEDPFQGIRDLDGLSQYMVP